MPFDAAILVDQMIVSYAEMPRYAGAIRSVSNGAIRWYFSLAAMTVAPDAFQNHEMEEALEAAINSGIVGPRQFQARYEQYRMVVFPSGKVFFANIQGTSSKEIPDDSHIQEKSQFLNDGSIVWEYTGLTVPETWQWFLLDTESDLNSPVMPDSTDAYAGLLAAAVSRFEPSPSWLGEGSGHGALSRLDVIANVVNSSIVDELDNEPGEPRLAQTFQHGEITADAEYSVRFLADNVEVWRGLSAMSELYEIAGKNEAAVSMAEIADDVKSGVLALWEDGRFKSYEGEQDHLALKGGDAFVTSLRFHIWPMLHGMLGPQEQVEYAQNVLDYTQAAVPGIGEMVLDQFMMAEWYYAALEISDDPYWAGVIVDRFESREANHITIVDAAITDVVQMQGQTPIDTGRAVAWNVTLPDRGDRRYQ